MIRNTLGKWLQEHHPSLDLEAAAAADPLLRPFTETRGGPKRSRWQAGAPWQTGWDGPGS